MLLEAAVTALGWLLLWWLPQASFSAHWWLWLLPLALAGLLAERWRDALLGPALGAVSYCVAVALVECWCVAQQRAFGLLPLALFLSLPVALPLAVLPAALAHGAKRLSSSR